MISQFVIYRYDLFYRYKAGLQRKQVYQDNTMLSTVRESTRSGRSDSSQTVLYTGEKRCNCLYNRHDLL